MSKSNSLVLKMFFGLVMLIGIGITSINFVSANNHSDTRFSRYSTSDGGDLVTPFRSKTDTSFMYAYNDQSSLHVYLRPAGSNGGSTYYVTQVSPGYTYVGKGTSKYIFNWVKEKEDYNKKPKPSYSHGGFLVSPGSHSSTWVSFLWSPDSI